MQANSIPDIFQYSTNDLSILTVKLEDSLTAMIRITKENEEIDKKRETTKGQTTLLYNFVHVITSFSL